MHIEDFQAIMVKEVSNVRLMLLNAPSGREMHIKAIGFSRSTGWDDALLELRDRDLPPIDGIYDFDFFTRARKAVEDGNWEKLHASYVWQTLPQNIRGIRIHAGDNSILKMI